MILEEYKLQNTKIKFYDDCIVENITNQKEYIDNIIFTLINKQIEGCRAEASGILAVTNKF